MAVGDVQGTTAEGYCVLAMGGKYYCALKCGDAIGHDGSADVDDGRFSLRRKLQLPPPTPLGLTCKLVAVSPSFFH